METNYIIVIRKIFPIEFVGQGKVSVYVTIRLVPFPIFHH